MFLFEQRKASPTRWEIGNTENLLNCCSGQGSLFNVWSCGWSWSMYKTYKIASHGAGIPVNSLVFCHQLFLISVTNSSVCCQEEGKSKDKAIVNTWPCEDCSPAHMSSAHRFWMKDSSGFSGFLFLLFLRQDGKSWRRTTHSLFSRGPTSINIPDIM